jgi:hypothetical protein
VSVTTTLNMGHDAMLFAESEAEHETRRDPSSREEPKGVLQEADRIPEPSTAEKFHEAITVGVLPFVGVNMRGTDELYGGQVRVGAMVSAFVMENEQVETLPALSVATQPMYTVPNPAKLTGLVSLQV